MNIRITDTFGDMLLSRPAGREAFLLARAYILKDIKPTEAIVLDFTDMKVLAPSWIDEFLGSIKSEYKNSIRFENTEQETVAASLSAIQVA